jgi:hypothetical protein
VKGRALRTVLALYQAGAGLGGLWVLLLSGQFHIHGPLLIRILLVALFTAYCVLLTSAGFLLGRAHALGVPLSVIAQGFQIPLLSSHAFTYAIATPSSLVLSVTSRLDIGLQFTIAAQLQVVVGRRPEVSYGGVNLLALAVLYSVTRRLATRSSSLAVPAA